MNRKELHLYRVKLIKSAQLPLLMPDRTARDIMLSAISEKPSKILENGTGWTVGNVVNEKDDSGSFAVGRITTKFVEKFDKESGDFIDQVDETGPYTLVYFDASIGLLGILKKSNVAATPASISRRVKELFDVTTSVIESSVEVKIDYIPDPDDFISKLKNAYTIKKFRASFTGPNPLDADEVFQKPLSVYCQSMNASTGAVEVIGNDIDSTAAELVARSTAATANTASATIVDNKGRKSRRIHMKKGALAIEISEDAGREEALAEMRAEYKRVRS